MTKRKGKSAQTVADRMDYLYGRYRIISGFMNDQYHAYAYTGSRIIHKVTGTDPDAVTKELKDFLSEHMEKLIQGRDPDGVPCAEEYREAIEAMKDEISKKHMVLLKAHAEKPGSTITIKELMKEADLDTLEEADNLYARIGRTVAIFLDFKPTAEELPLRLKPVYTIALPQGEKNGLWEWALRPQMIEALKEAKI